MRNRLVLFLVLVSGCKECGDNTGNTYSLSVQVTNPPVLPLPADIKLVPMPIPYPVHSAEKCP